MHYWGDDWFENNGKDLYAAIDFVENYLRKHHIGICGKEKYGCYDETTEVLTNNGWKSFKDLTFNDQIATLKDGEYLEYQTPTDIMQYDFNGNMYHLQNRGVDIFVTDNHNLYVSKGSYFKNNIKHTYEYELCKPNKYYHQDKRFKKGCKWEGTISEELFKIEGYTNYDECTRKNGTTYKRKHVYPEFTCDLKTFLKFLGFFVAEGSVYKTQINIAHNHLTETLFVKELIESINFETHFDKSNNNTQYFCSSLLAKWLLENCGHLAYNKKVPNFVKNLPSEYIEIFLKYLYKGDGHKTETSNILTTTSKQLSDDVCELLLKCGYTFSLNVRNRKNHETILKETNRKISPKHIIYEVNWLKNTEVEIEMSKVNNGIIKSYIEEYVPFNGRVYCATVPNHIMYVRRNGKGYWCGNSYRDEYLRFWDGGIYEILFGYRCFIGTYKHYKNEKVKNFIDQIHHFIYYKIDQGTPSKKENESLEEYWKRYEKRIWKGLSHYTNKIGLVKLVHRYQASIYNKAFQLACKKWPMVTKELIVFIDGYKMIKPCKWGNVDGKKIHMKYWKTFDQVKKEENLI